MGAAGWLRPTDIASWRFNPTSPHLNIPITNITKHVLLLMRITLQQAKETNSSPPIHALPLIEAADTRLVETLLCQRSSTSTLDPIRPVPLLRER